MITLPDHGTEEGWAPAEEAGHAGPDRHRLMPGRTEGDAGQLLVQVRRYAVAQLSDRDAVLIVARFPSPDRTGGCL